LINDRGLKILYNEGINSKLKKITPNKSSSTIILRKKLVDSNITQILP
jgi:hypothetical protein